jgi:hypothetical protein
MTEHIFNKYLEIKQDLIQNIKDVFNLQTYYTHKYRGNINTDINVAIYPSADNNNVIRIFVRHKGIWIRDEMEVNRKGIIKSKISNNFYE